MSSDKERTAKQCFLSAAHYHLAELREMGVHDARVDQARELIRQVLAETLVDNAIEELASHYCNSTKGEGS